MDNHKLVKLMKAERACVMRNSSGCDPAYANGCDKDCLHCDLVQDDKELIQAYTEIIAKLENPHYAQIIPCYMCDYWDKNSGLTARDCRKHKIVTVQYGFCSDAKPIVTK